jgi:hypothetical protein
MVPLKKAAPALKTAIGIAIGAVVGAILKNYPQWFAFTNVLAIVSLGASGMMLSASTTFILVRGGIKGSLVKMPLAMLGVALVAFLAAAAFAFLLPSEFVSNLETTLPNQVRLMRMFSIWFALVQIICLPILGRIIIKRIQPSSEDIEKSSSLISSMVRDMACITLKILPYVACSFMVCMIAQQAMPIVLFIALIMSLLAFLLSAFL